MILPNPPYMFAGVDCLRDCLTPLHVCRGYPTILPNPPPLHAQVNSLLLDTREEILDYRDKYQEVFRP